MAFGFGDADVACDAPVGAVVVAADGDGVVPLPAVAPCASQLLCQIVAMHSDHRIRAPVRFRVIETGPPRGVCSP